MSTIQGIRCLFTFVTQDLINEHNGGCRHYSLSRITLKKLPLHLFIFFPSLALITLHKSPKIHLIFRCHTFQQHIFIRSCYDLSTYKECTLISVCFLTHEPSSLHTKLELQRCRHLNLDISFRQGSRTLRPLIIAINFFFSLFSLSFSKAATKQILFTKN